jgi:predicted O-linked N-acetylglucosamine transferase (SPINDLY family)
MKRPQEAKAAYRKSVELDPVDAKVFNNLGGFLVDNRQPEEAVICFRRAVELKPDFHSARSNLLHQLQHLYAWDDISESEIISVRHAVSCELSDSDVPVAPFAFLALPSVTAVEQRACAEQFMKKELENLMRWKNQAGFTFRDNQAGPLHIGYLSADLNNHVIARQIVEIFELHDRSRFRITAYSCGADDGSSLRKRAEAAFDSFVDIQNMTLKDAAAKINSDGVDILVDLTSYTKNSRSPLLALRPAPIQVNYLGYPGSMGVDFVDYIIADRFIIPPEHFENYTEKVLWLPDSNMPHDSKTPHPPAPSRSECGLPENSLVFCCFNAPYKVTPAVFDVWCRLLKEVPDSVLWMLTLNPTAENNLKNEATARGVDPSRIIFQPYVSLEEYFARLQCADLFLDTNPYSAHGTCSNALWMGLPVLTCAGSTFASRVAGSHLTTMGVPELVTYSLEEYHDLALELSNDRKRLSEIRSRIITGRETSPLFDSRRFTRNLEDLYLKMWDEYQTKNAKDV